MQNQIETKNQNERVIANLIINGDLSKLSQSEKVEYYKVYCERIGLDPFTKPFDILRLNGREILYCTRSGTQQLNKLHQVSHKIVSRETLAESGVYYVIAQATLPDGRCTESIGAVNINGMKGDMLANSIMKAETKAKRRSTLDLLGLGVLDESELDTINTQTKTIVQDIIPAIANEQANEQANDKQITQSEIKSDDISPDIKLKKGRKKKQEQIIVSVDSEIEQSIFEKKYDNSDDIELVLASANTIGELRTLYFANQLMVDSNKGLKELFTNAKNNITNGK